MDLLINWVAQIIIFILLATILDLLVPASSMKKYIKFVIGLILILIFLQPIFYIFNVDIQEAVRNSVFSVIEGSPNEKEVENLIEMQKSEIESSTGAYILEQMAVQLKNIARAPLLDNYQVEIVDIKFQFLEGTVLSYPSSENLYEELEEIIVYLETGAGEGAVDAVEDVVIDTGKQTIKTEENIDLQGIQSLLRETWELTDKKLTIRWEGGAS